MALETKFIKPEKCENYNIYKKPIMPKNDQITVQHIQHKHKTSQNWTKIIIKCQKAKNWIINLQNSRGPTSPNIIHIHHKTLKLLWNYFLITTFSIKHTSQIQRYSTGDKINQTWKMRKLQYLQKTNNAKKMTK